jgi:hypothetical protein
MATIINFTAAGSSTTIDDAILMGAADIGAGTYAFLDLSRLPTKSGNERSFNSDDTPPIDPSSQDIDHSKVHTDLLSTVPGTIVGDVEYYKFRVDHNESNSNPNGQISLDAFKARVGWVPARRRSISHDAQGPPRAPT